MSPARRRVLAVFLAGVGLYACYRETDPVEIDVKSARQETVPPGGRIASATPTRREGRNVRASWEVESEMTWEDYSEWVASNLGDYRVVANEQESLRMRLQLEGDVYTLLFTPRPEARSLTVQVSFESSPF